MLNINTIDSSINVYNGDIIAGNFHWSSTQVLVDSLGGDIRYAYGAWPYTTNGPFISTKSKNTAYLVRAIRCIDNDCSFTTPTAISDHAIRRELIKVTDILGRETGKNSQPHFCIYNDGTVEKRMVIE